MLTSQEQKDIVNLIKEEVVLSIGCTEPAAVSLCVAKATELLGSLPDKIDVFLSANILKNAMGVGIPGTNMIGLPIAVALGASIGKSGYGLQVLKDLRPEDVEAGKRYIDEDRINIELKKTSEMLYIEVRCKTGNSSSAAIISGTHTSFTYLEKDEKTILKEYTSTGETDNNNELKLSFRKVYDFATIADLDSIRFIEESARVNKKAVELSEKNNHGHSVAKTVTGSLGKHVFGNTILSNMLSYTASACDARMDGAMIPIMSNSGSGNQGITATLPVLSYAEDMKANEEDTIRALILSHLTVIYIKQKLGRLSALCGCVAAATGASCGITLLMGGKYEQATYTVKNMIANISGMLCDGAKPSCALKISSGVSTAALSAIMAMENKVVSPIEGIVDEDVDKTIDNLVKISTVGMKKTDEIVLEIMTNK